MNKQKRLILGIILLIVIFMGIGYAVISNVELKITGTATATGNQENFNVCFTGQSSKSENVTVNIGANSKEATVDFSGLSTKGNTEYAILEIENRSTDISAEALTVEVTSSNQEVFNATAIMCTQDGAEIENTELAPGAKTYVKVSTELLKTVVDDSSSTITAKITATPKAN